MFVALLPGALQPGVTTSDSIPAANPSNPTVTIPPVAPPQPTDGGEPWENELAIRSMNSRPEHYKCLDYPEASKLRRNDLIPTANVSSRIMFDPHTGSNEVVTVDPRIIISHHVFENRVKLDPDADWQTVTRDTYSWTYADSTEHFDVLVYGSVSGQPRWRWLDPSFDLQPDEHGVYTMSLGREPDSGILIVATDTSTCEAGNQMPQGLWQSLGFDAER